jgi:invasion protein IalB
MKPAFVVSAAALAALLISGAAMAADPAASSTSQDRRSPGTSKDSNSSSKSQSDRSSRDAVTAPPAEKPGLFSMPHRVTGTVVSVEKESNSVNVKNNDGKELTLVADADTVADLSRLKPGDQVKITYKKTKDQMVAIKIATNGAGTTSKAK